MARPKKQTKPKQTREEYNRKRREYYWRNHKRREEELALKRKRYHENAEKRAEILRKDRERYAQSALRRHKRSLQHKRWRQLKIQEVGKKAWSKIIADRYQKRLQKMREEGTLEAFRKHQHQTYMDRKVRTILAELAEERAAKAALDKPD